MKLTEIKGDLFDRKLEHPSEYYVHCISGDYACGAGIEVNGIRFSNISEMLCYMNKQREQLIKAKELIKGLLITCSAYGAISKTIIDAEQFLKVI